VLIYCSFILGSQTPIDVIVNQSGRAFPETSNVFHADGIKPFAQSREVTVISIKSAVAGKIAAEMKSKLAIPVMQPVAVAPQRDIELSPSAQFFIRLKAFDPLVKSSVSLLTLTVFLTVHVFPDAPGQSVTP
jgi:hypothetical protein